MPDTRAAHVRMQRWLLPVSGVATAAGLALPARGAAVAFTAAQTLLLVSLAVRSLGERYGWRGAQFVVAAAVFALYTIPCWMYAIDPGMLDRGDTARATLIVNVALYAYALGLFLTGSTGPRSDGLLQVPAVQPRTTVLVAWWLLGFVAISVLLLRHGSPLDYLAHLDQTASLNEGAFYLVAAALTTRFAALAWAAALWSQGRPLPRRVIGLAVAGTVFFALIGARLFVAAAIVDFLLLYALLRRPLRLRQVAPYVVAGAVLIIFGGGTIKRYQAYTVTNPQSGVGFMEYATHTAPGEFATAYANNYVDGVRLIAIADELVPAAAGYEYARPLLELAVKPLPRSIRPTIGRQRALREAFSPDPKYAFAMPLFGTAFLSGGIVAVFLLSLGVGALVARLDRVLASSATSIATVVTAVVAIVNVPVLLRSGIPLGATLFLVEVVGMWVVARTGLRSAPPPGSPAPGARIGETTPPPARPPLVEEQSS